MRLGVSAALVDGALVPGDVTNVGWNAVVPVASIASPART